MIPLGQGPDPELVADENDAAAIAEITAIARAVASMPRPPLSSAFRSRLHGDLVRLEARLAADEARRALGWGWRATLRRLTGSADRSVDPMAVARRQSFAKMRGVPAALALVAVIAAAASVVYAAERSRPGDALWPLHAAYLRWRTGDGAAHDPEPDALDRVDQSASAGERGGAPIVMPHATVVGRAARPATATATGVPPATMRRDRSSLGIAPLTDGLARPYSPGPTPWPVGAVVDEGAPTEPPEPRPVGVSTSTGVPLEPVRPRRAPSTPSTPSPRPATPTGGPSPTIQPSPSGVAAPTATPTVEPTAEPTIAMLTGVVRMRDGATVMPLAGVEVAVARVAADFPSGCDPIAPPMDARAVTTDADGNWTVGVAAGRWIIAVTGGCLGSGRLYLADFNGAVAVDACAALALPVVDGGAVPSTVIVIPQDAAPGCGPPPTATAQP